MLEGSIACNASGRTIHAVSGRAKPESATIAKNTIPNQRSSASCGSALDASAFR